MFYSGIYWEMMSSRPKRQIFSSTVSEQVLITDVVLGGSDLDIGGSKVSTE